MYDHLTDEQQIEFIKKVWKEYGLSLIIGIAVAIALSLGWQSYQKYQAQHSEKASILYEMMMGYLGTGSKSEALQYAETIKTQYPRTPYASLAALTLAKNFVEKNQFEPAMQQLTWTIQHSQSRNFRQVARLRLARIQLAQGKPEIALKTLESIDSPAFQSNLLDIKGDIYKRLGQTAQARQAYQEAISLLHEQAVNYPLLKMKLNNLPE